MTAGAKAATAGKKLADELDELAETLNRYGYVLFGETTKQEKEWIDNAFSKVAIRLHEIAKASRRSTVTLASSSQHTASIAKVREAVEVLPRFNIETDNFEKGSAWMEETPDGDYLDRIQVLAALATPQVQSKEGTTVK